MTPSLNAADATTRCWSTCDMDPDLVAGFPDPGTVEPMRRSLATAAVVALLGVLALAGCTFQHALPHPAPTSAKQTAADFVYAAKAGDYTSLAKITNPGAGDQVRKVATQLHKAVGTSGCSISAQSIREWGAGWWGNSTVKCAGKSNVTDYTVSIAQYSWKISGAVASNHSPVH